MLISAASGLEKLMMGHRGNTLKDSNVAQISAAIYYQAHALEKLVNSKPLHQNFQKIIFKQIDEDFGQYIDAQARVKTRSFHHVYEWNKIGLKSARLFKLKSSDTEGFSFKISFDFLDSKAAVPNKFSNRKHVFVKKASIMEAGNPLVIRPTYSERLVFNIGEDVIYMPKGKSVTIRKPGGVATKTSFTAAYERFFTSNLVSMSIKKSGFQNIFSASALRALRIPANIKKVSYKFQPNIIKSQAEASARIAAGGVLVG